MISASYPADSSVFIPPSPPALPSSPPTLPPLPPLPPTLPPLPPALPPLPPASSLIVAVILFALPPSLVSESVASVINVSVCVSSPNF